MCPSALNAKARIVRDRSLGNQEGPPQKLMNKQQNNRVNYKWLLFSRRFSVGKVTQPGSIKSFWTIPVLLNTMKLFFSRCSVRSFGCLLANSAIPVATLAMQIFSVVCNYS